jgi:hypothetical protein
MNPDKLIRDASKIHACMKRLPDRSVIVTKALKVYIPARFSERDLATIGMETYICGIYAIVLDDTYYGVDMTNAMIRIEPTSTAKVMIHGDEHYEFYFEPGSVFTPSVDLVQKDTLPYKIFDEIFSKGRVPWYLSYTDMGRVFKSAKKHAGANIGGNNEVTELLASMNARDAKDRHKYYRSTLTSLKEIHSRPPAWVGLRSVTYAATNTTNKLAGSHFADGVVSALNSPAERTEPIEKLLRL